MNRAATMKSEPPLAAEDDRRAEARSSLDPPHSSLTDGSSDLLPRRDAAGNCHTTKHRIFGSRLGGVKVRHKRQVLQDMARPLKHWLYKHKDNPYPTKTEKVLLALGSHMTLVQVSNWFANARRRLKNTVRQPDLSWAMRIKLYNQYIQGNAERLSVCSDGGDSDDEAGPFTTPVNPSGLSKSSAHQNPFQNRNSVLATADSAHSDGSTSPPSKYKSSLLNRYLNDTLRHMMAAEADGVTKRRIHSESFSEYDQDVVSPASSFETEANFVYQMDTADFTSTSCDRDHDQNRRQQNQIHQGWREIHAAVALTNLAQGQSCTADLSGLAEAGTDTGRSGTREPISARRTPTIDKMCVTGSGSALRQSSAAGPTLTSRIIQKSSHISEVQTVNVVLADGAEAS